MVRDTPGVPGRAARREGGARLRHHEGGARRLAGPHARERRGRQPGDRRGGRLPSRSAASCRTCRRACDELAPADGETARSRPTAGARRGCSGSLVPRNPRQAHRRPPAASSWSSTRARSSRSRPCYGRARITGLARIDGYPVGHHGQRPDAHLGGATDVAAGAKAVRLIQLCDTVPPAARRLRRRARPHGRPRVGASGHRAGRRPAGVRHLSTAGCRGSRSSIRRLYGVGGQAHHRAVGHVPPLRLAVGQLGVDAHRRRRGGRLPPGDRGGARSRRQAGRDRGTACRRWRRRSAPPRPPARTSSTRATPGRCWPSSSRTPSASWPRQLGPPPIPYRP